MNPLLIATFVVLILILTMVAAILVVVLSEKQRRASDDEVDVLDNWRVDLWNFSGGYSITVPFRGTIVLGRKNIYQYINSLKNPAIDPAISREHFMLFEQDGVLWIQNMSSINPLHINGFQVGTARQLQVGDQLSVGKSLFLVTRADRISPDLK